MKKNYDYQIKDFKIERTKSNKKYYIKIKEEYIEVNEEIFKTCRRSRDKIKYEYKKEVAKSVIYYDDIDDATFFVAKKPLSMIDQLLINDLVNKEKEEISSLPDTDRRIAECIFLDEMSERETAKLLSIPKSTISYRKKVIRKKILEEIKKTFGQL